MCNGQPPNLRLGEGEEIMQLGGNQVGGGHSTMVDAMSMDVNAVGPTGLHARARMLADAAAASPTVVASVGVAIRYQR
jgi:hypothetical protein